MRFLIALALLTASPALAWQATIGTTCTLTHETDTAQVTLTYDPAQPLYSITVTRKSGTWTGGPLFEMVFEGPAGNRIATPLHALSADGTALSVTDRGFGNVLDGLQFNETARARLGGQEIRFDLEGAAPEVQAFRECRPLPLA